MEHKKIATWLNSKGLDNGITMFDEDEKTIIEFHDLDKQPDQTILDAAEALDATALDADTSVDDLTTREKVEEYFSLYKDLLALRELKLEALPAKYVTLIDIRIAAIEAKLPFI